MKKITLHLKPSEKTINVTEEQKDEMIFLDLIKRKGDYLVISECDELTEFLNENNIKIK